MKKFILPAFVPVALLCGVYVWNLEVPKHTTPTDRYPANIASTCVELIESFFSRGREAEITGSSIDDVKKLAKKFDVPADKIETITSFDEAIEAVFKATMKDGKTSTNKSEIVAKFGESIRKMYTSSAANLSKEAIKDLDYLLGRSVLKAESFRASEFEKVAEEGMAIGRNTNLLHINYKQYKDYTIGFEDNKAPFVGLDMSGGTIITRNDIREMEALNYFPVYITHDMKHVRYALHHERYFPMLFNAARSKNHKRYVMIGALGEGADTVQYMEERAICTYFDEKGFDLEDAMMYLARATDKELDKILDESGTKDDFERLVREYYTNWTPKETPKYSTNGFSGVGLDQELDEMVIYLRKQHTDPDLKTRYKNRESEIKHY